MANRGSILAALFLSCAILPLLASANFEIPLPNLPGIVKGIEGGESFPGFSHSWMQNPREQWPGEPQPIPGPEEPQPIPGPEEPQPTPGALQEGFYQQSCPQAEKIVNEALNKILQKDPTIAPALVRLFFHDCFVTGCDASILLDRTPSGEDVEKNSPQNGKFVRGFEAIDEIKAQLEAECPGVVSCADVLAFANRDSLVYTGVPSFNVAAGRRDGLASLARNGEFNLPFPESTAQQMTELFQRKGMTLEEMVMLTGAHSIGAAHCTVVAGRFRDPEKSKVIDRGYLLKMQVMTMCQNDTQDLAFDPYSQQKMDSRFYKELLRNRALLESDQNLVLEPNANGVMKKYVNDQNGWLASFTAAITKLGGIEVLTGNQGEIRKQCRFVN
ncbi:peroxidase 39 [Phtheirospermum japonicum]|uniref:Peroxidase n=1 Tax=Phtheirospermum japonicum TaxID=374723 RepID=A0A830CD00_9LAMI|nr:peroxidase 39 [Phtheirospermum japonicum]